MNQQNPHLVEMADVPQACIINGKLHLTYPGVLAVCQSDPSFKGLKEEITGSMSNKDFTCTCTVSRDGHPAVVRQFSWLDAVEAGFLGKAAGPWAAMPDRMICAKAKMRALRAAFAELVSHTENTTLKAEEIKHP